MNKISLLAGAAAMVMAFGLSAQAGHKDGHFKGIFEAPMMNAEGAVEGSEGKIGRFGQYKVEVSFEALAEDGDFKLCLRSAASLDGAASDAFLQTVSLLAGDDELEAVGELAAGNLYRPAFRVFVGGEAETCNGDVLFESGTSVEEEII